MHLISVGLTIFLGAPRLIVIENGFVWSNQDLTDWDPVTLYDDIDLGQQWFM